MLRKISTFQSAKFIIRKIVWPNLPQRTKIGLGVLLATILLAGVLTATTPIPFKYFIDSLSSGTIHQIDLSYFALPLTLLIYAGLFFRLR